MFLSFNCWRQLLFRILFSLSHETFQVTTHLLLFAFMNIKLNSDQHFVKSPLFLSHREKPMLFRNALCFDLAHISHSCSEYLSLLQSYYDRRYVKKKNRKQIIFVNVKCNIVVHIYQ